MSGIVPGKPGTDKALTGGPGGNKPMTDIPVTGEISIIHAPSVEEPFLLVNKPSGLASAPLREGDDSAVTRLLPDFPAIARVRGRKAVEGGLVHRLDTQTSGLLLIAASQDFYDRIIAEQEAGKFIKTYTAVCDNARSIPPAEGFPPRPPFAEQGATGGRSYSLRVESRFRSWGPHGREVRPVSESSGPGAVKKASPGLYRTELSLEPYEDGTVSATCRIARGYRHQVRCHLAWLGFPVKGDVLYNPAAKAGDALCFHATGLAFLGLSFSLY